jgi:phosphohistidine swiveling domain-containing protein
MRENKLYDFKSGILKFFNTYGHYSESVLDLSQKTFRENPDLVLKMIKEYRTPERFNESQRLDNLSQLPISTWGKMILDHLYKLAVCAFTNRDKITYLYNFGYGLFRPRFQRLGRIFLEKGYILQEDDVFYLRLEQIEEIINNVTANGEYSSLCQKIKSEISACSTMVLPEVIIGDSLPPVVQDKRSSDIIKGVPVSKGFAEGTLRVIRTQEDFSKMNDNDILLIPYSDISWTPLFTRAKAIVSEAGGFLSHCAIIAREFGIPAVVAINHAGELSDGDIVSVNGFTGEVIRVKSN